jgi:hypothetical protein
MELIACHSSGAQNFEVTPRFLENVVSLMLIYCVSHVLMHVFKINFTCSDVEGNISPLTPNDRYSGRTAPLTSKAAFHIFIQQI